MRLCRKYGQGNSVIAHTDDPSSVFFNPALINKLDGTQIEIGTTILIPRTSFHSDVTGRDFKTEDDAFFPPTLFVTHKFSDSREQRNPHPQRLEGHLLGECGRKIPGKQSPCSYGRVYLRKGSHPGQHFRSLDSR